MVTPSFLIVLAMKLWHTHLVEKNYSKPLRDAFEGNVKYKMQELKRKQVRVNIRSTGK